MRTVRCSNCGELLAADGVDPPPESQPCPKCGSTEQSTAIEVPVGGIEMRGYVGKLTVVDYPHVLLQEAETLILRTQYGAAVMVAHVACEIGVRQALSRALTANGVSAWEDPTLQLFNGYSLLRKNEKDFYRAVTGDVGLTKRSFGSHMSRRLSGGMTTLIKGFRAVRQKHGNP